MSSSGPGNSDKTALLISAVALAASIGSIIDLAAKRARERQDRLVGESKASPGYAWKRVGEDLRKALEREGSAPRQ